jgi:hypothetical protein
MKTLDNFSKRVVAIAILFFALATFIFSLSTITPASAATKISKETAATDMDQIAPISVGISGGKAYWLTFNNGPRLNSLLLSDAR